jgi:acyl-CoA thioesterase-1
MFNVGRVRGDDGMPVVNGIFGWGSRRIIACALAIAMLLGFAAVSWAEEKNRPVKLVVVGDSLSAGFNLAPSESFPSRLGQALKKRGLAVEVMNAAVSGDTIAAALQRIEWALPEDADAVILELGGNDALRGLDPAQSRMALDSIMKIIASRKLPILLAGMKAPRNLGPEYADKFDRIYPELAKSHNALLYPFFLDGVALDPGLNLADGIHPIAKGVDVIVERILPLVADLIARARQRG